MSSASDESRKYPVVCPACDRVKGYPYQARTVTDKPRSVEVLLRCRDCNHEWVEIVASRD